MTLLHNVSCCCMTRLVTLRITTPQSTTKRCVCVCVCVSEKDRERWCREGGLLSCPWVSEGIVIDCTAVAFNYVCLQSMQKAAGAKVTFLHSDYSCLLCGSTVLFFHWLPCYTHLQSFLVRPAVLPSMNLWFHSFGDTQWHKWAKHSNNPRNVFRKQS